jgi:hypothetical protein
MSFRKMLADLWIWLRAETTARSTEARLAEWTPLDAASLFAKHGRGAPL